MSEYLLQITIGPVQEFIAQARRTRDLWHGSHLLSELSRCVARTLANAGAELIFPALAKGDAELAYAPAPLRENRKPPLNVANVILARVPEGIDPQELASNAREELIGFWCDRIAADVRNKKNRKGEKEIESLLAANIDAVWKEQIETLPEFFAAWKELDGGNYTETRDALIKAIAARKKLREFGQWQADRLGAPKSSLDGARVSVLRDNRNGVKAFRKYRIGDNEQLDAVGVVKRCGGKPDQFVPLPNVALAPWMLEARKRYSDLRNAVHHAVKGIKGFPKVKRGDLKVGEICNFDASIFMPSRWRSLLEEELGLDKNKRQEIEKKVRPLLKGMGEPNPYVACLVADGDRMGATLDRLDSIKAHRDFSSKLSEFATRARQIVEQDFHGLLVYSGGDDVLAFLPVPEAVACADALHQVFRDVMQEALSGWQDDLPTLSVGIGIGHVLEGMGDLLNLGREAEQLAKGGELPKQQQRNALAIILDKRSGARRHWRERWEKDPATLLKQSAELVGTRISTRKIYQIADMLRRLPDAAAVKGEEADVWLRILIHEVNRILARMGEDGVTPQEAGLKLDEGGDYGEQRRLLARWIDRMLIARAIRDAEPKPQEGNGKQEAA